MDDKQFENIDDLLKSATIPDPESIVDLNQEFDWESENVGELEHLKELDDIEDLDENVELVEEIKEINSDIDLNPLISDEIESTIDHETDFESEIEKIVKDSENPDLAVLELVLERMVLNGELEVIYDEKTGEKLYQHASK
jgi:hypothetical protein